MARSSGRRADLFIQVGGDVTPLRTSMKAGQSVLNEFGLAAIDVQKEVDRAFAEMGRNAPAEAKRLEQSYAKTFAEIRRNAKQVLNAPDGQAGVQILNAAGARQAAEAAEAEAAALRNVADAAIRADRAAKGTNAGVRVLAVSSATAAKEAGQHAAALRAQAAALDVVEAELIGAGGAQQRYAAQQAKLANDNGRVRAGFTQLSFQIGDVSQQMALGVDNSRIFAQQSGQVIQALQVMGGEGNKFLRFLGGPWGIAIATATVVLAPFIGKLFDTGNEVDKLVDKMRKQAEQARLNEVANRIWEQSLDGLIEKTKKLREEQDRQLETDRERQRAQLKSLQDDHANANAKIAAAERRLQAARAELREAERRDQELKRAGAPGLAGEDAVRLFELRDRVARLAQEYNDATVAAGRFLDLIGGQEVLIARDEARALSDPLEAIRVKYQELKRAAEEAARGNETLRASLKQTLADLDVKEKAELDAAAEALRKSNNNALALFKSNIIATEGTGKNPLSSATGFGQFLNGTWLREFDKVFPQFKKLTDEAKLALRDNKQVAEAIIDSYARANEKFLKGFGATITAANLYLAHFLGPAGAKKVLQADPNTPVAQVVSPAALKANPFIAKTGTAGGLRAEIARRIGDSSSAQSQGLVAVQAELERQAKKRLEQDDNAAIQMQRLDEQLIAAQTELVQNVEAEARFAQARVDEEQRLFELQIQKAVNDGRIRDEQGKELIERSKTVAEQRKVNIEMRRFVRSLEERQLAVDQEYQFRIEELQYLKEVARTTDERLKIELQIIDLSYEQRDFDLRIARAKAVSAQQWEEVARIDAQMTQLARQRSRDQDRARRNNQSPMERYRDSLPQTLADVQERLEEIQVLGLRGLENDLVSAAQKALKLKGALGEVVGELIRLGFQILASQLFNGGTNGGILGNIFGGGRHLGGPVSRSKFYLVGEDGPELFAPGASGMIVPNSVLSSATPRGLYPQAANDSGVGGRPLIQNWNIRTSDADSFQRNRRQMARDERRRLSLSR